MPRVPRRPRADKERIVALLLAFEATAHLGSPARADVVISGSFNASINLESPPPLFQTPPSNGTTALIQLGASVVVNNGDAVFGQNKAWDVTNDGTLRSLNGLGLNLNQGRSIINNATGVISGTFQGARFQNSSGTLTNSGQIEASAGIGMRLEQGGTVQNNQGALIRGTSGGVHYQNGTASLTNSGSITASAGIGARLEQGGTVQNNGGTIRGTTTGLHFQNGTATLTNTGLIEATDGIGVNVVPGGNLQNTGGTIVGTTEGVHLQNGTVQLTNSGLIQAVSGIGISVVTGQATIQNALGGSIRGAGSGAGVRFTNSGSLNNAGEVRAGASAIAVDFMNGGTLVNNGTIGGGTTGVHVRNNANITNTGVVDGAAFGLNIEGGPGNVTNSGEITAGGASGIGVQFLNGGTLNNSGTISGPASAVSITNSGTVTNTGLIAGGTTSVAFLNGNGTLILNTGSTLVGTADGAGNSATILRGTGSAANDFTRFGSLSMEGTAWTIAGQRAEFNQANLRTGELTLTGNLTSAQTLIDPGGAAVVAGAAAAWSNSGTFTVGDPFE